MTPIAADLTAPPRDDAVARLPAAMAATARIDVAARLASGQPAIVSTMNPFLVYLSMRDGAVAEYTAQSDVVTCDSSNLKWVGRVSGLPLVTQTGADIVEDVLSRESTGPVVVVGPEAALVGVLETPNPLIAVECPYSPDLEILLESTLSGLDAALEAQQIESTFPLYLVALGPRKQEFIANGLIRRRGARRVICCGASIDFLTGKERRAPQFFRRAGLEWVWRFFQNPSKKAKVVFVYSPKGLLAFLRASRRYRRSERGAQ